MPGVPSSKSSSPPPSGNLKRSAGESSSSRSNSDRGGIDTHPFMRGSVIEVLYGVKKVDDSDLDEDYEDDDEDDEDDALNRYDDKGEKDVGKQTDSEVRLADIIDRAPSATPNHQDPAYRYRYYIHYREYNRRMDEWISDPQRIISPPSVGNAKVREMKKAKVKAAKEEEERKIREKMRQGIWPEEEGKRRKSTAVINDGQTVSPGGRTCSQRVSSRRAIAAITNSVNTSSTSSGTTISAPSLSTGSTKKISKVDDCKSTSSSNNTTSLSSVNMANEDNEEFRLTRRQRRKSSRGKNEESEKIPSGPSVVTTLLPDQDHIKDKVVTVAARELDEHEGLDEASLREHEEVTKVKNVGEVQLGRYRMDAWYFSPIPKELLQNGHTVEILYVCEFSLKFFSRKEELLRFQAKILPRNERHPPGNEIYR
jgi:hypothetical protein